MSSLEFHIAITKNLQYKTHPEFWPSHRRIFKTSLYYKTRYIRDKTVDYRRIYVSLGLNELMSFLTV